MKQLPVMKKTLNSLTLAAAVCLTLGGTLQSAAACETVQYRRYSVREYDRTPVVVERTDRPFIARAITWPFRAASTVVRSPIILGETVAGERAVVRDDGRFFARRNLVRSEPIVYRNVSYAPRRVAYRTVRTTDHAMVGSRRLAHRTSRTVAHTGTTTKYVVHRTGNTLQRAGESTGRGIVRTGRTIVHTPMIIGETLTGRRHVVSNEGRLFASNR
jgi:hypothetical protein